MPGPASDIRRKELRPTAEGSREIRDWPAEVRRRAFFSARVEEERVLEAMRGACAAVADGALDASAARLRVLEALESCGMDTAGAGGLRDISSRLRLDLVLKTQRQTAQSMGQMARSEDPEVAAVFPAWELASGAWRRVHRDWYARWKAAGDSVGWQGARRMLSAGDRMVALKSSPIWAALGEGAGGFRDTLGNPFPPFAWNSSYIWLDVDADEAAELGLVAGTEDA